MNLRKLIFTENRCYKAGRTIKPKGIMVHSTGANNPWLKRYVGPDDGLLGKNAYNNHWNNSDPSVCVHGFIGKLADGRIATYQTLPWDHRAWHAGGSANDTHISFEICEDALKDGEYFQKVYHEAIELCVYLCHMFGLTEKDIICHSEGHKKGIASNHGDVMHWFPNHGKSMDTFRADVKALLEGADKPSEPVQKEEPKKVETTKEVCTVEIKILRKGDKGNEVKAMQILLAGNGCKCGSSGADGDFGPATEGALKEYQQKKNLEVDAICGPATWASLLGMK
jgi:hypothetical protein